MLCMLTGRLPLFVTEIVFGGLVVPRTCFPNESRCGLTFDAACTGVAEAAKATHIRQLTHTISNLNMLSRDCRSFTNDSLA